MQETVAGAGDCPTILVMVFHDQTVFFGAVPKAAVVVGTSTGTVLDAQNIIVVVHHFVQECGADFLDGTGQGTGSNIDLMGGTLLADQVSSRREKWP